MDQTSLYLSPYLQPLKCQDVMLSGVLIRCIPIWVSHGNWVSHVITLFAFRSWMMVSLDASTPPVIANHLVWSMISPRVLYSAEKISLFVPVRTVIVLPDLVTWISFLAIASPLYSSTPCPQ